MSPKGNSSRKGPSTRANVGRSLGAAARAAFLVLAGAGLAACTDGPATSQKIGFLATLSTNPASLNYSPPNPNLTIESTFADNSGVVTGTVTPNRQILPVSFLSGRVADNDGGLGFVDETRRASSNVLARIMGYGGRAVSQTSTVASAYYESYTASRFDGGTNESPNNVTFNIFRDRGLVANMIFYQRQDTLTGGGHSVLVTGDALPSVCEINATTLGCIDPDNPPENYQPNTQNNVALNITDPSDDQDDPQLQRVRVQGKYVYQGTLASGQRSALGEVSTGGYFTMVADFGTTVGASGTYSYEGGHGDATLTASGPINLLTGRFGGTGTGTSAKFQENSDANEVDSTFYGQFHGSEVQSISGIWHTNESDDATPNLLSPRHAGAFTGSRSRYEFADLSSVTTATQDTGNRWVTFTGNGGLTSGVLSRVENKLYTRRLAWVAGPNINQFLSNLETTSRSSDYAQTIDNIRIPGLATFTRDNSVQRPTAYYGTYEISGTGTLAKYEDKGGTSSIYLRNPASGGDSFYVLGAPYTPILGADFAPYRDGEFTAMTDNNGTADDDSDDVSYMAGNFTYYGLFTSMTFAQIGAPNLGSFTLAATFDTRAGAANMSKVTGFTVTGITGFTSPTSVDEDIDHDTGRFTLTHGTGASANRFEGQFHGFGAVGVSGVWYAQNGASAGAFSGARLQYDVRRQDVHNLRPDELIGPTGSGAVRVTINDFSEYNPLTETPDPEHITEINLVVARGVEAFTELAQQGNSPQIKAFREMDLTLDYWTSSNPNEFSRYLVAQTVRDDASTEDVDESADPATNFLIGGEQDAAQVWIDDSGLARMAVFQSSSNGFNLTTGERYSAPISTGIYRYPGLALVGTPSSTGVFEFNVDIDFGNQTFDNFNVTFPQSQGFRTLNQSQPGRLDRTTGKLYTPYLNYSNPTAVLPRNTFLFGQLHGVGGLALSGVWFGSRGENWGAFIAGRRDNLAIQFDADASDTDASTNDPEPDPVSGEAGIGRLGVGEALVRTRASDTPRTKTREMTYIVPNIDDFLEKANKRDTAIIDEIFNSDSAAYTPATTIDTKPVSLTRYQFPDSLLDMFLVDYTAADDDDALFVSGPDASLTPSGEFTFRGVLTSGDAATVAAPDETGTFTLEVNFPANSLTNDDGDPTGVFADELAFVGVLGTERLTFGELGTPQSENFRLNRGTGRFIARNLDYGSGTENASLYGSFHSTRFIGGVSGVWNSTGSVVKTGGFVGVRDTMAERLGAVLTKSASEPLDNGNGAGRARAVTRPAATVQQIFKERETAFIAPEINNLVSAINGGTSLALDEVFKEDVTGLTDQTSTVTGWGLKSGTRTIDGKSVTVRVYQDTDSDAANNADLYLLDFPTGDDDMAFVIGSQYTPTVFPRGEHAFRGVITSGDLASVGAPDAQGAFTLKVDFTAARFAFHGTLGTDLLRWGDITGTPTSQSVNVTTGRFTATSLTFGAASASSPPRATLYGQFHGTDEVNGVSGVWHTNFTSPPDYKAGAFVGRISPLAYASRYGSVLRKDASEDLDNNNGAGRARISNGQTGANLREYATAFIAPEINDLVSAIDNRNSAIANYILGFQASTTVPGTSTVDRWNVRTATATIAGASVALKAYFDNDSNAANNTALYLLDYPTGTDDAVFVTGPYFEATPVGEHAYQGVITVGDIADVGAPSAEGSFYLKADFGRSNFGFEGTLGSNLLRTAGGFAAPGDLVEFGVALRNTDGRFSATNLTFGAADAETPTMASLFGRFHGDGANTAVSGVWHTNQVTSDSLTAISLMGGAFVGRTAPDYATRLGEVLEKGEDEDLDNANGAGRVQKRDETVTPHKVREMYVIAPDINDLVSSAAKGDSAAINYAFNLDFSSLTAGTATTTANLGTGTTTIDSNSVNVTVYKDKNEDVYLYLLAVSGEDDKVIVSGTPYSGIPIGKFTYEGLVTANDLATVGAADSTIGNFTMDANFDQGEFSIDGTLGDDKLMGGLRLNYDTGRLTQVTVRYGPESSASTNPTTTVYGQFHGENATEGVSGVWHTNGQSDHKAGAFIGRRQQ